MRAEGLWAMPNFTYTKTVLHQNSEGTLGLGTFPEYHRSLGEKVELRASVCLLMLADPGPECRSHLPPPSPLPSHHLLSTCLPYWPRVESHSTLKSTRAEFLTQPHVSYILPSICHLFIEKEADEKEDFLKTRKRKCEVLSIHVRLLTHPAPLQRVGGGFVRRVPTLPGKY